MPLKTDRGPPYMAVSILRGPLLVGVLTIRAFLVGV